MATASLGGAFGSQVLRMWLMCLPPCWCPPKFHKQPANLHDLTPLRAPGPEPCIPERRGKVLSGFLCCLLLCSLIVGARSSHFSSFLPNELAFSPSFLLASQALACLGPYFDFACPKAGLATEAEDVPLSLSLCSGPWNRDHSCFGAQIPGACWH